MGSLLSRLYLARLYQNRLVLALSQAQTPRIAQISVHNYNERLGYALYFER